MRYIVEKVGEDTVSKGDVYVGLINFGSFVSYAESRVRSVDGEGFRFSPSFFGCGNIRQGCYVRFENMSGIVIHRRRNDRFFSVGEQDLDFSSEFFEGWLKKRGIET